MPVRPLCGLIIISLFFAAHIFAQQDRNQHKAHGPKCGLTYFYQQQQGSAASKKSVFDVFQSSQRPPDMPYTYVSPSGQFKFHYTLVGQHAIDGSSTNSEGIPDWVYVASQAFEHSHYLLVDSLGFLPPVDDRGVDGPEFDVYFQDLSSYGDVYGLTFPEQASLENLHASSAYMLLENDFSGSFYTKGLDAVRVTAAHEYFHAIHFAYTVRLTDEDLFFYEMSSTWFEDVAYDDINDYFGYLQDLFNSPETPAFAFQGSDTKVYALSIFLHYWLKNREYASLRRMWEHFDNLGGLLTLEREITNQGLSFSNVLAEFFGWCLYTSFRAEPETYFEEGADYPLMRISDSLSVFTEQGLDTTTTINVLSARFYRLDFDATSTFTAQITKGSSASRIAWASQFVSGKLRELETGSVLRIASTENEGSAIIAIVNAYMPETQQPPFIFHDYEIEFGFQEGEFSGFAAAPNPFKIGRAVDAVQLVYKIDRTESLSLRVFTEDGRLVWETKTQNLNAVEWDGRNQNGEHVPTGIYIVVLETADGLRKLTKLAVIR